MKLARVTLLLALVYILLPLGIMLLLAIQKGIISSLMSDTLFLSSLTHSLALGVVSTLAALMLSLLIFGFLPEVKRQKLYVVALVLGILPPFLLTMGISKMVFTFGVVEGFWTLSLAHAIPIFPYMLFFTMLGMARVPENVRLSARLYSGASITRFLKFYLFFMKPSLLAGILLGLTVSLSQYVMNLMLWREVTLTSALVPFIQSGEFGKASVYGMVFVLNIPLMLYFAQKLLKVK